MLIQKIVNNQNKILLLLIFILAATLRLYGIDWDQGHHLHPDERMIIMVADGLSFPDKLNPEFFAYGSFPIYLLKFVSWIFGQDTYSGMLAVGRLLSVSFDFGTVILVYLIARELNLKFQAPSTPKQSRCPSGRFRAGKSQTISIGILPPLAAFFYAISVLPIQSSHFFISDIPLTFFTTLTLYLLIKFLRKLGADRHSIFTILLIGTSFGLALATKLTAVILLAPILATIFLSFMQYRNLRQTILSLFLVFGFSFLVFALTMPFALLDFSSFKQQTFLQSRMQSDPFIFPYTLQYVGTTPYLYYLKNIFLWGLGPILSTLALIGVIFLLRCVLQIEVSRRKKISLLITLSFYLFYFLIIGRSAVKFMRYLLPLYPFLVILAAVAATRLLALATNKKTPITRGFLAGVGVHPHPSDTCIHNILHNTIFVKLRRAGGLHSTPVDTGATHVSDGAGTSPIHPPLFLIITYIILIFLGSMWTLAFLSIYSRPHTRVAASEWIYQNIPAGATLALEHWDDGLPLPGAKSDALNKKKASLLSRATTSSDYNIIQLPLYDPDTPAKWQAINEKLAITDFIIIASNRLYTPLMKLTDCSQLPKDRCYPLTAQYYHDLFSGRRGFTKVAEFTSYPRLEFGIWNLEFRDEVADESFTVYDHPKVIIFKKKSANL